MSEKNLTKTRYCKVCQTTRETDARGMREHGDEHRAEDLAKWRKEYAARPAPKPMVPIGEVSAN